VSKANKKQQRLCVELDFLVIEGHHHHPSSPSVSQQQQQQHQLSC